MSHAAVADVRPLSHFLRMAVVAGVERAVRIHIERGDDLNARDSNGLTPLMLSAARNKATICKLLLDAGADGSLVAPSGKTALAFAMAVGAHDAVAVLESAVALNKHPDDLVPGVPPHSECCSGHLNGQIQPVENLTGPVTPATIGADVASLNTNDVVADLRRQDDAPEFDLLGWEAEEDSPPPDADLSIAEAASEIQSAIAKYEPLDSSTDWEDIDAYLPERSLPLVRTDDAEARERLRLLLLRAIREGSVPFMGVEALSISEDRSSNLEAELLLSMVVNDLGAEVDERFEYSSTFENFEVFINPDATPDEEDIVEDSLAFIDGLASSRTDPLRIYQKEFQRARLISAQEEVSLAQAMEIGFEKALDALAAWPRGISLTLSAGQLVKTGQRPLSWISLGPAESLPDLNLGADGECEAELAAQELSDEQIESNDDSQFEAIQLSGGLDSDFLEAMSILASVADCDTQQRADCHAIRAALSSLRLNRRFLLELADIAEDGDSAPAAQYVEAIAVYQRARERMAVTNLKLVFHLAKRYLYTGEPLDDLAQEGNIGLMKAIERFDWRRGFKFSTYATWWIRQQIGRHIADKCRTVRVPVHVHEKVQRILRETQVFEAEANRVPQLDEIAVRLNMPVRKVAALQRLALEPLPIHEWQIDELIAIETRSDFALPDPMDIASHSELLLTIDKLLATLKPKEEQILRLRFGLGACDTLTLEEIGTQYEVTRERVRQIEAAAIRKLRHPNRANALANAAFGKPNLPDPKEEEIRREVDHTDQTPEAKSLRSQTPHEGNLMNLSVLPPTKASSIDRLLAQAGELGIGTTDDREGVSGRVWVQLIEITDLRSRRLCRTLLALGFEFMPGKGYWK